LLGEIPSRLEFLRPRTDSILPVKPGTSRRKFGVFLILPAQ
jgi:hypothetical protein